MTTSDQLTDAEMYDRMRNGWRGGLQDGTVCGNGSTLWNTRHIRAWLPIMCEIYGIKSVNDAGAGDLHWVDRCMWSVDYRGFDLIPRVDGVTELDISKTAMPNADAILCRMVLNHLDEARIVAALSLFEESATYLFATHFVGNNTNTTRQFVRLDLTRWLGEPVEMCDDGHERNCRLALWKM